MSSGYVTDLLLRPWYCLNRNCNIFVIIFISSTWFSVWSSAIMDQEFLQWLLKNFSSTFNGSCSKAFWHQWQFVYDLIFFTYLTSMTTLPTVVDRLTKFAHFFANTSSFSAAQVADLFFHEVFRLHGLPKNIVSDRDSKFLSTFWQEVFKMSGTVLTPSASYHPQTDGQT